MLQAVERRLRTRDKAAGGAVSVSLLDMVLCCARGLDFLHPQISEHHLRVAMIAAAVARAMGLPDRSVHDVLVAGALHDIGAVSRPAWRGLLDQALLRYGAVEAAQGVHLHGEEGYLLLRDFPPFANAAATIRFHHVEWAHGAGRHQHGDEVPLTSHILHLADRAAVLPDDPGDALEHMQSYRRAIAADAGTRFHPEVVHAFDEASASEAFWLDVVSRRKEEILKKRFGALAVRLSLDGLYRMAEIFGRVIDCRSAYTASHSSGVAAVSELLASRSGLALEQQRLIGVAGYLHDIGKLALPAELLDKPGRLTEQEMRLVRQHPYFTQQILSAVPGLEQVGLWAALHHERLDGTGYPFRRAALPFEARIVGVADIFTAITEDRPYRQGMGRDAGLQVLSELVRNGAIDAQLVALIADSYPEFSDACRASSVGKPSRSCASRIA